jgi:hypothetical protein
LSITLLLLPGGSTRRRCSPRVGFEEDSVSGQGCAARRVDGVEADHAVELYAVRQAR